MAKKKAAKFTPIDWDEVDKAYHTERGAFYQPPAEKKTPWYVYIAAYGMSALIIAGIVGIVVVLTETRDRGVQTVKQTPEESQEVFFQWDQKNRVLTIPPGNADFTIIIPLGEQEKFEVTAESLREGAKAMIKMMGDSGPVLAR